MRVCRYLIPGLTDAWNATRYQDEMKVALQSALPRLIKEIDPLE